MDKQYFILLTYLQNLPKKIVLYYSWIPLMRTRLFRIPCHLELKTIPLGFALQSNTIGYFKLFFVSPEGFNCI